MTPLEHPMRKRKIGRSIGPSSHMHDWRRLMGTRSLIFLLIHSNEIAPVLPIAMKLTSLLTAFEPYYGFSRFTGASMPAKRVVQGRQWIIEMHRPVGGRMPTHRRMRGGRRRSWPVHFCDFSTFLVFAIFYSFKHHQ